MPHLTKAYYAFTYSIGIMVGLIVRVSYTSTGIPSGQVGSGRSLTEPTLAYVARGEIRYANWGLNKLMGEMFIKKLHGAQLPFPFFFAFLSPQFPSSFIPTSSPGDGWGMRERLSSLADPRAKLGRQTTFSEFWAERVLLVRTILVIITLYICSPLGCRC